MNTFVNGLALSFCLLPKLQNISKSYIYIFIPDTRDKSVIQMGVSWVCISDSYFHTSVFYQIKQNLQTFYLAFHLKTGINSDER